jgi:predicted PurR-regulated permease PerM
VILALFVGGELFGFMGILLALPAAAVAKIFVIRGVRRYRESALYLTPRERAMSEIDPEEFPATSTRPPPAG